MLKKIIKVIDENQMARVHASALKVLEKTGLQIKGKFLLKACADAGCRVDFDNQRVWFKPDLIEKQIKAQAGRYKMVRSSLWYPFCRNLPKDDVAWPDEFCVDFGHGAPWLYQYPGGQYAKPKINDQIDVIKLGNALDAVKAVSAPFICGDFDSRLEIIESARLLLLNTKKPGWVGTSCGKEVKYLAEFAALAADGNQNTLRTSPPIVVTAYCTTSPLKLDTRSCEVLEEAIKYKFPVNFAPMPILGGTTPVTPAGSMVVATAEILGCITAVSLIDPDLFFYATSISSEMDMKTSQLCYASPAAILTDAALHQLFRFKYGIVLNVEPAYIEAKCPGIQAAFMKTYRQMAFGSTVSCSLPIGLLDNGSTFSPVQAMIDLDVNAALYKFGQGIEINDDTLAVDLINEMGFCEKTAYIETEHTLNCFRDILWDTKIFDRQSRQDKNYPTGEVDDKLLKKADRMWRDLVAAQQPVEVEPSFVAELDRIVAHAKKELLA